MVENSSGKNLRNELLETRIDRLIIVENLYDQIQKTNQQSIRTIDSSHTSPREVINLLPEPIKLPQSLQKSSLEVPIVLESENICIGTTENTDNQILNTQHENLDLKNAQNTQVLAYPAKSLDYETYDNQNIDLLDLLNKNTQIINQIVVDKDETPMFIQMTNEIPIIDREVYDNKIFIVDQTQENIETGINQSEILIESCIESYQSQSKVHECDTSYGNLEMTNQSNQKYIKMLSSVMEIEKNIAENVHDLHEDCDETEVNTISLENQVESDLNINSKTIQNIQDSHVEFHNLIQESYLILHPFTIISEKSETSILSKKVASILSISSH